MSSSQSHSNTSSSSAAQRKRTFTVHEEESLFALTALLRNESRSIYASGRFYLFNLVRWREQIAVAAAADSANKSEKSLERNATPEEQYKNVEDTSLQKSKKPSSSATGILTQEFSSDNPSVTLSKDSKKSSIQSERKEANNCEVDQPSLESDPDTSTSTATSHGGKLNSKYSNFYHRSQDLIRPDQNPEVLIDWRTNIAEWFFNMADGCKFERNSAIKALAFLDIYAMHVCFPGHAPGTLSSSSSASPSPKKARTEENSNADSDPLNGMSRQQYSLAAFACFYIAAKVYNSGPQVISSNVLSNMVRGKFTAEQIEEMEVEILTILRFRVNPPTAVTYVWELMPMLQPNGVCSNANIDGANNDMAENYFSDRLSAPGNFGSCTWVPKTETQAAIVTSASYYCELATYSPFYPLLSMIGPSKIALAAIIEAAGRVYCANGDSDGQANFQARVHDLSDIAESDCQWAPMKAFEYCDDIKYAQTRISAMLRQYSVEEHDIENKCTNEETARMNASLVSPNGVQMGVSVCASKTPSMRSASSPSAIKEKSSSFSSSAQAIFHKYSKSSSSRVNRKSRSQRTSNPKKSRTTSANPSNISPCKVHRTWEQTEYSAITSDRRFYADEIFEALKEVEQ